MRDRYNEKLTRQTEHVARLTAVVEGYVRTNDAERAEFYSEMLVEAQDRLRQTIGDYRATVSDETHVIVGDHPPEPRHQ